jgi:hypothetical protein
MPKDISELLHLSIDFNVALASQEITDASYLLNGRLYEQAPGNG